MKRLAVFLLAFLGILTAGTSANAVMVYSTFGPNQTFESQGWVIGSPGLQMQVAAGFTPAINVTLDSIDFAAVYVYGLNQLTVDLVSDSSGLPLGSVIESFNFANLLTPWPGTILTANSSLHPLLTASTQYWVLLTATDLMDTYDAWPVNNQGIVGPLAWNSTLMTGLTWELHTNEVPAFDVKGTPAVPEPINDPPVSDAGPDQTVSEGAVVQLSGSNSTDPNGIGDIASYQWKQTSGPAVTLSDPAAIHPTFIAPTVGAEGASLIFQLTVTDKGGLTSQDTCIVNVTWINQPPIAHAGCPTVPEGTIVQLDASGTTDADDGIFSYQWVQKSGPQVILSDPGAIKPTFTAPEVGLQGAGLTFELTVTDNHGLSASDRCTVNITWVNAPPVANAGTNQTVNERTSVTLDGSGSSDPDDGIASYKWTQLSGPPVTLSDPTSRRPSFVAPDVQHAGATLIFELTVTDNEGLKSSARCTVNVLWVNTLPIVDAGPNVTIQSKDQPLTTLQGTASDPDGDPLTYRWVEGISVLSSWQTVAVDEKAMLNLSTIPPFSIGKHTLTLEVNDGYETSKDDMILNIGNSAPNAMPTGAGTYQINTPVILGGQVADYDGDLLSYQWLEGATVLTSGSLTTKVMGEPVNLPQFTISNLKVGIHTITLQVTDGINSPVSTSIKVNIIDTTAPTLAPVANKSILWPPNHKMVDIAIAANASDNSGLPAKLSAVVASNELTNGLGDGDISPDWTDPVIDQVRGVIILNLRAERSGRGNGRQYTVTITATDESGNASTANVKILVPHDQGGE